MFIDEALNREIDNIREAIEDCLRERPELADYKVFRVADMDGEALEIRFKSGDL